MKIALDHGGVEVQQMAEYLGVSRETIRRYMTLETMPKRHVKLAWAMRTGVDSGWLETGEAPTPDDGDGGQEYGIRDSNPEPADSGDSPVTWDDAA